MRRSFAIALALSAALVVATAAGASTKFASTEEITASGSLVVTFDEGSQKRFTAVEYRLDASALVIIDIDADHQYRAVTSASATVTLTPDSRGRVTGALIQPVMFWLLLGGGLHASFRPAGVTDEHAATVIDVTFDS